MISKAACFWTSECSAGVSPAWVSRSMAAETPNTVIIAHKREGHRRPACVRRMAWRFLMSRCVKDHQSQHGRDGHAPFFLTAILTALGEAPALQENLRKSHFRQTLA
jgi:hypothetical protein